MSNFPHNSIFDVLHEDIGKRQTPIKNQNKGCIDNHIQLKNTLLSFEDFDKFEKKEKRIKRKRVYEVNSKWSQLDIMKYWKFYVKLAIQMPYICISWNSWKIDSLFIKMSKVLNKKPEQCKSFDERMKHTYSSKKIDILDVAYIKLQQYCQFDEETYEILKQYVQVCRIKSAHMQLLEKKLESTQIALNILQGLFYQ